MPLRNERKTDQPCQRQHVSAGRRIIAAISIAWALFQLALPRLIILDSTTVRAVHLAFAITLVFLTYRGRAKRKWKTDVPKAESRIPLIDYILAGFACLSVLYFVFDWTGITMRAGLPIPRDVVISVILIVLLLEATRRAIGSALAIIAILFTLYAFLGPYMPLIFAFRGVSLRRYLSQIALSTEGIYGIPLYVSANTVFLFVLLGSMLSPFTSLPIQFFCLYCSGQCLIRLGPDIFSMTLRSLYLVDLRAAQQRQPLSQAD